MHIGRLKKYFTSVNQELIIQTKEFYYVIDYFWAQSTKCRVEMLEINPYFGQKV